MLAVHDWDWVVLSEVDLPQLVVKVELKDVSRDTELSAPMSPTLAETFSDTLNLTPAVTAVLVLYVSVRESVHEIEFATDGVTVSDLLLIQSDEIALGSVPVTDGKLYFSSVNSYKTAGSDTKWKHN
jgi:hypothetical protein